MSKAKTNTAPKSDLKVEARKIREFADSLIKQGKAKAFLVEHGFVTPSGRISKRYGG